MASQAGVDGAQVILPMQANAIDYGFLTLRDAGLIPGQNFKFNTHGIKMNVDGNNLTLTTDFTLGFAPTGSGLDTEPIVLFKGSVTMNIDLAAEPSIETVDEKEVFIPQFTMENGRVDFEAVQ